MPCACGPDSPTAKEVSRAIGYSDEQMMTVPEGANLGLGCGNPTALASLKPGDIVLDLGSGAGFDVFLAAARVGPEGHVIGVDMTPDMLERARTNAATAGVDNVEFRLGEIEHLPVADDSIDVIISNCVVNLSPDKGHVFREAFRVLRPGGHVVVSDIVLTGELSGEILASLEAYVGCVAGASQLDDYIDGLADAGFDRIDVLTTRRFDSKDDVLGEELIAATAMLGVSQEDALSAAHNVASVTIEAVRADRQTG